MRARRQLDDADKDGASPTASQQRLLSLLGLGQGDIPDVTTLWARPLPEETNAHLRTPIGLKVDGSPVWLDLREGFSGGDGPHGVLSGTTGTGKTTVLQSLLFGLCAQNSPDNLQVMLISGKGETAFTNFADYPHVTTVPDGSDYTELLSALIADRIETLRRVDALSDEDWIADGVDDLPADDADSGSEGIEEADTAVEDEPTTNPSVENLDEHFGAGSVRAVRAAPQAGTIGDYHYVRSQVVDGALPPLPYTVLVLSELGELTRQDPGLGYAVESVLRKGRSLGIHVLIANQVLDPITAGRISNHTTYRITMGSDPMDGSNAVRVPSARGSGLYVSRPGAEPVAFQGFMVSPELVRDVGRRVARVPDGC
ncbi:hypothetical protein LIX17_25730 (plasmid) [Mycobacterium avium subsp. hominissuis]|uniref:FtsK/SpoIIIE domain-containing protein n=1 Tax=Mycobacterium avium TaxID=1764 RepID=UPI0031405932